MSPVENGTLHADSKNQQHVHFIFYCMAAAAMRAQEAHTLVSFQHLKRIRFMPGGAPAGAPAGHPLAPQNQGVPSNACSCRGRAPPQCTLRHRSQQLVHHRIGVERSRRVVHVLRQAQACEHTQKLQHIMGTLLASPGPCECQIGIQRAGLADYVIPGTKHQFMLLQKRKFSPTMLHLYAAPLLAAA